MSHRIGTLQVLSPTITIGPDSGSPATSPGTWLLKFPPAPAPTGTRFVILHFTSANFPASNSLEVDLGYDTDVFTTTDGPDFWTRPIKLAADGTVTIRSLTNGSTNGHVLLGEYGRGEPMESVNITSPERHNHTNPDLFLLDSPYVEPSYELRGFCSTTPNWENIAAVPPGDVRATVAQSVCIFVHVEINEDNHQTDLSSCTGTLIAPDMVLCAGHCVNGYLSITEVQRDIAATPPLAIKRDVMMVLDRSGSMSMDAGTGHTKIEEARDATSLFVQLIRLFASEMRTARRPAIPA